MSLTINIHFATAIKQRTANYPWLDYEGFGYDGSKPWSKEIDDYWQFISWLTDRFNSERIDKRDFQYTNKVVLVVAPEEIIGEYIFFCHSGKLAELYKNDKLDELYEEYHSSR